LGLVLVQPWFTIICTTMESTTK